MNLSVCVCCIYGIFYGIMAWDFIMDYIMRHRVYFGLEMMHEFSIETINKLVWATFFSYLSWIVWCIGLCILNSNKDFKVVQISS